MTSYRLKLMPYFAEDDAWTAAAEQLRAARIE